MIHLMAQKLPIPARSDKIWLPVNFATVAAKSNPNDSAQPAVSLPSVLVIIEMTKAAMTVGATYSMALSIMGGKEYLAKAKIKKARMA
jgi:hypothetical protein